MLPRSSSNRGPCCSGDPTSISRRRTMLTRSYGYLYRCAAPPATACVARRPSTGRAVCGAAVTYGSYQTVKKSEIVCEDEPISESVVVGVKLVLACRRRSSLVARWQLGVLRNSTHVSARFMFPRGLCSARFGAGEESTSSKTITRRNLCFHSIRDENNSRFRLSLRLNHVPSIYLCSSIMTSSSCGIHTKTCCFFPLRMQVFSRYIFIFLDANEMTRLDYQ